MRLLQTLFSFIPFVAFASARPTDKADCEILKSVKLSFYGRQDIMDPIAYPECGRSSAGGKGTYESPLTMATAPGEFGKCEIVYIPYLLKYVRFEDICVDCVKSYSTGKLQMQIWTGNSMIGGQEQAQCQKDFTPTYAMPIIRHPGKGQLIDTTPLYQWGAAEPCRLDHRYSILNVNVFCYDKKEAAADHRQEQKNSVHAMKSQYGHHEEAAQNAEQVQYEEPAQMESSAVQDQEVFYDQSDGQWQLQDDGGWLLQQDPEKTRIIL